MMALGLHTIVSLAKLYSEQVESIMAGPLEAIQATGANRLQTIIYAVIPQIVPPYISYTMYRWTSMCACPPSSGLWAAAALASCSSKTSTAQLTALQAPRCLPLPSFVASMDYISSVLREKYV